MMAAPPARTLRASDVAVLALSGLSPVASVYITGSAILKLAGTGAAAALLAGGAIQVLASFLYAELASAFPSSGGVYPGVSAILGRSAGFAVVVLALITSPAFLAFVALGLADYLRVLQPVAPKLPLALGALCAATLTAVLAIRTNAWITGPLPRRRSCGIAGADLRRPASGARTERRSAPPGGCGRLEGHGADIGPDLGARGGVGQLRVLGREPRNQLRR